MKNKQPNQVVTVANLKRVAAKHKDISVDGSRGEIMARFASHFKIGCNCFQP
jgi:hypothetical protein